MSVQAVGQDGEPSDRQRVLGARLHELRRARGLTRSQVAAAVDVSTSFLGMVERGETDLALARFTRLTGCLGVSVSDLLEDDPPPAPPQVYPISGAPAVDRGEGIDYRVIRREHPQLVAVTLAPGAEFADTRSHRGEDIWIVVEGSATFLYGAKRYAAAAGNIVSFPGIVPHGVANESDVPVSLIAVCSVSYW
jgi:transcriptional regulator with XRE-family HTH domain